MLVTMMLAMAAPNPHAIDAPRKAYAACIKAFESKSLDAKMDATAYSPAVKAACRAEAEALTRVLIDYDMAMGTKRASAVANAASDLADYTANSEERYHFAMPGSANSQLAKSAPATTKAPVTQASVTK
jgi:hypothetical protein